MSYRLSLLVLLVALDLNISISVDRPFGSLSGGPAFGVAAARAEESLLTPRPPTTASGDAARLVATVGHRQGISSIAWSRDGSLLLSGSADNTAKLWHVKSGSLIRSISASKGYVRGLRNAVSQVAIGAQDQHLLVCGSDGARRWDARTGELLKVIEAPTDWVGALATARDVEIFATAGIGSPDRGARPFIRIHRGSSNPTELALTKEHSIDALAMSRSGDLLVAGGWDKARETPGGVETESAIHVWDVNARKKLASWPAPKEGIQWLAVSPEAEVLYARSNGVLSVYRLSGGDKVHSFSAYNVALSNDGRWLALDVGDASDSDQARAVELRDSKSGELVLAVPWPPDDEKTRSHVSSLAFEPNGSSLAIGFNGGKIAVWDFAAKSYSLVRLSREWGPSKPQAVDQQGRRIAVAGEGNVALWDMGTGARMIFPFHARHDVDVVTISRDGALVAAGSKQGTVNVWETASGRMLADFSAHIGSVTALGFSNDRKKLLTGSYGGARLWSSEGNLLASLGENFPIIRAAVFRPGDAEIMLGDELGEITIFSGAKWQNKRSIPSPGINATVQDLAFDAAGRRMIVGYGNGYNRAIIYNFDKNSQLTLAPHQAAVWTVALSPDGSYAATGSGDETAVLWSTTSGQAVLPGFAHSGSVVGVGFTMYGRSIVTYADQTLSLRPLTSQDQSLQLFELGRGRWAAVAQDGRFDTNDLENVRELNWVMPDDPLRPLPLEAFMREYFEPGLLSRSIACRIAAERDKTACDSEFRAISPISTLNRVQPKVRIAGFKRGNSADEVLVTVEVTGAKDPSQANGKFATDAYDLRLFRDNQLVQRRTSTVAPIGDPGNRAAWRAAMKVSGTTFEFRVRLARQDRGRDIGFTAYAFNEDRVKSETARATYPAPADMPPPRPRAYVITIGINEYLEGDRNLSFAVKDARDTARALRTISGFDVVPISLLSEGLVKNATKKKIRGVFRILAGDASERKLLAEIPNSDRLQKATPEDLVIMTFSGHGHTQRDGAFYLLPADALAAPEITQSVLASFVSSEELSEWVEGVDAGQLAFVIDACHSAASVKAPGFKPGPMGDRGLGQLAYDKGMRILAASQEAEVAIEIGRLRQGLLTYALVQEGLGGNGGALQADSNRDRKVTLDEWLKYGETRTPLLYEDARAGKIPMVSRDSKVAPGFVQEMARKLQTPVLFDYHRNNRSAVVKTR